MSGCCSSKELNMKIMYHEDNLKRIEKIEIGDWIDLRAAEQVLFYEKGQFELISLGISVQIPEGYEMHIVPRSSTYKNFGIMQVNSMGIIDSSYCHSTDIIKFPAIAMKDNCSIEFNDRICQFRLVQKQSKLNFTEVGNLDSNKARGGFGSTGVR